MAQWLLLDGFNLLFRSFHGMPDLRTKKDNVPTGAVHGWLRTLWHLQDTRKPDHLAVFFDLGGSTAREAEQSGYKAQRSEMPPDLIPQIGFTRRLTLALGIPVIERQGVEADDLLGSCALRLAAAGHDAWLVSADKDLGQAVGGRVKQLLPPSTSAPETGWRELDAAGVEERSGVPPRLIPDLLALTGDTVDNIAGLDGVGPKTAAKWLQKYGSLEGVIQNCGMLNPVRFQGVVYASADRLRSNLRMTRLHEVECPVPEKLTPNLLAVTSLLAELEMNRSVEDARRRLAAFGA